MATENQNFFKHYDDTFALVVNVTDVTDTLNDFYAYWGVATSPSSSVRLQKETNPGFGETSTDGDITISGQTITIALDQADFTTSGDSYGLYTGSWYHELTIGTASNGSDSVVIASGYFTVKEDLFPSRSSA